MVATRSIWQAAGNALYSEGHYAAAIDKYSEAIEAAPTEAKYYGNRAAAYMKLGQVRGIGRVVTRNRLPLLPHSTMLRLIFATVGVFAFSGDEQSKTRRRRLRWTRRSPRDICALPPATCSRDGGPRYGLFVVRSDLFLVLFELATVCLVPSAPPYT